jgi:uncharacterized protein
MCRVCFAISAQADAQIARGRPGNLECSIYPGIDLRWQQAGLQLSEGWLSPHTIAAKVSSELPTWNPNSNLPAAAFADRATLESSISKWSCPRQKDASFASWDEFTRPCAGHALHLLAPSSNRYGPARKMKVIVSGASGMVGTALASSLCAQGHAVVPLVRRRTTQPSFQEIRWDPLSAQVDVHAMEGADAVVHLSGANVSQGRWTPARKEILRSSRLDSTRVLVDSLARLRQKPRVFISASAVGYYGNRGDQILTESAGPGNDFLSLLARDWEAEAMRAAQSGIRTVILRFGVILSSKGGALPEMVRPFKFGAGGRLGSGRQWISWIALKDAIDIIQSSITSPEWIGPINVVAPEPVRNSEFAEVLGRTLHRPAILPAPAFLLRVALGEMADALLLSSQRAIPESLLQHSYSFRFANIETALQTMLPPR